MTADLRLGHRRQRKRGRAAARIATVCLLASAALTLVHYVRFINTDFPLPNGVTLGGIPVGGLRGDRAIAQLQAVYATPVTLHYRESVFQLQPQRVDFRVYGADMLRQLTLPDAPTRFWDTLRGRPQLPAPQDIALQASFSQEQLRAFLQDVASRYDTSAYAPWSDVNQLVTVISPPAQLLRIDASLPFVEAALQRPTERSAELLFGIRPPDAPTLELLEGQLRDYLKRRSFDGLLSLYLVDLRSGAELQRNWLRAKALPVEPGVAFSGMSIMKITLLAEFYRQVSGGALPYELDLVEKAVTESSNWTSNLLIEWIGDLDAGRGLQRLNQTYEHLGLQSTFIGGLYDTEEPPGFRHTPANSRSDVNTQPDAYMQTTPADIGRLLRGIYRCARSGDGLLIDTFGTEFTPQECATMLDWLSANRIGVLLEAGVPEGTVVAHKHGWAQGEPIGDAGVVFTSGGDYVLVYYVWVPDYTYWHENSQLLADVSKAVYFYFNPITP
ncbi:MAG: serine hydrolase [Anaerolineales bacterium]|jgi:hypothetical protein|nr:serine hydrolase [Anaerolineales bacterium]HJO33022.1 serine hydrolase [Anaerolineales bacterium]